MVVHAGHRGGRVNTLITTPQEHSITLDPVISLVLDSVDSPHTGVARCPRGRWMATGLDESELAKER